MVRLCGSAVEESGRHPSVEDDGRGDVGTVVVRTAVEGWEGGAIEEGRAAEQSPLISSVSVSVSLPSSSTFQLRHPLG